MMQEKQTEKMSSKTERAWIEISLENLRHNVETLRNAMPPECELMAVVKTAAYGHGAYEISANLNKMGVTAFAVATIEEGIELREYGICGEILILGYTDVRRAFDLNRYELIQTLIDYEYAKVLNEQGITVKAHIKIDTGMHRLGVPSSEVSAVRKIFSMENISVCGMYTHLCCPDSREPDDVAFTRGQIAAFYRAADALQADGIDLPKLHIQSSYGFLNYPELACDYVRAGIALYGALPPVRQTVQHATRLFPGGDTVLKLDLRPVLSLKSRVVLIRFVEKGESVGYGRSFKSERDSRIAILAIGYGDGFPRSLSDGKGSALLNGNKVPVIGRICMDQLAVDITDAGEVSVGDIATLIGEEGDDALPAFVIADCAGSISNELLCRMGRRLPVVVR